MIDQNYPCATCGCDAWKHYKSISAASDVCIGCYTNVMHTPDKYRDKPEFRPAHEFIADNLKYLELKEQQEARTKAMPGLAGVSYDYIAIDEAGQYNG